MTQKYSFKEYCGFRESNVNESWWSTWAKEGSWFEPRKKKKRRLPKHRRWIDGREDDAPTTPAGPPPLPKPKGYDPDLDVEDAVQKFKYDPRAFAGLAHGPDDPGSEDDFIPDDEDDYGTSKYKFDRDTLSGLSSGDSFDDDQLDIDDFPPAPPKPYPPPPPLPTEKPDIPSREHPNDPGKHFGQGRRIPKSGQDKYLRIDPRDAWIREMHLAGRTKAEIAAELMASAYAPATLAAAKSLITKTLNQA